MTVQWLAQYTTTNQNNNVNISTGISGTLLANPILTALLTLLKYKVLEVLKIFWIKLASYYFQLKTPIQLIKSILIFVSSLYSRFQSILLFPSKFCIVLGKKLCKGEEMFSPVLWHEFQRLVYDSVRDSDADCGSPRLHLVLPPLY